MTQLDERPAPATSGTLACDPEHAEYLRWREERATMSALPESDSTSFRLDAEESIADLDLSNAVRDFMYLALYAAAEVEEVAGDPATRADSETARTLMQIVANVSRVSTALLSSLVVEQDTGQGVDLADLVGRGPHPDIPGGSLGGLLATRSANLHAPARRRPVPAGGARLVSG